MYRCWTVDTCVLYDCVSEKNCDAFYFLHRIKIKKDKVALDIEGYIKAEYQTCIKKTRSQDKFFRDFIVNWFNIVVSRSVIKYCGNLDTRNKKALKKLNFHYKDLPFVAVCKKTKDKILVTKDERCYNREVKEYLFEKMEIHVLSIQDSINL